MRQLKALLKQGQTREALEQIRDDLADRLETVGMTPNERVSTIKCLILVQEKIGVVAPGATAPTSSDDDAVAPNVVMMNRDRRRSS